MKAWVAGLILSGVGFGVGFFAGERYGRKKAQSEDIQNAIPDDPATVTLYENADDLGGTIAKQAGYITDDDIEAPDENVLAVMDEYLSQFESPKEDPIDMDDEEAIKRHPVSRPEDEFITLITAEEYDAEETYTHVNLVYYEEDEVVCDESEARVEDPEDLIGSYALSTFGQNPLNPADAVYVRNSWNEMVYEITRIHNSYGRVVLGIDEDYEFYRNE